MKVKHFFCTGRDSDEVLFKAGEPSPWVPDEDTTATINYTSGTTARPKGVEMTHRCCGPMRPYLVGKQASTIVMCIYSTPDVSLQWLGDAVRINCYGCTSSGTQKVDGKINRIGAWSYADVRSSRSGSSNLGCSIGMGWPHTRLGVTRIVVAGAHHLHQLSKE